MELTRGDHCKKELPRGRGAMSQGFNVETRDGIDVAMFDGQAGPWNFCSWACMSDYAQPRSNRR